MKEKELIRLIKASQLYYEQNMTQAEIAREMEISRPSVSNLLARARKEGLVTITVKPFESTTFGKAQVLRDYFDLKSCQVVAVGSTKKETEQNISNQVVDTLLSVLPRTRVLGLGWGYNMGQVVGALCQREIKEKLSATLCPMIGTATIPHKGYHPNELCTDVSQKLGIPAEFLISPAFPTTRQEYRLFINTENYANIYTLWKRMDTCMVTLGGYPCVPDHATASRFGRRLVSERAVGNMLSFFFDIHGNAIRGEDDCAIQIPLKQLGRIRNFIGVAPAGGSASAVIGCLNTHVVKHLVIDEGIAGEVVKYLYDTEKLGKFDEGGAIL